MKNTQFQLNISKIMPAGPKNTGPWDVNNNMDSVIVSKNPK